MFPLNLHHNTGGEILLGHAGAEFASSAQGAKALGLLLEPIRGLPAVRVFTHTPAQPESEDEEAVLAARVGAPPL